MARSSTVSIAFVAFLTSAALTSGCSGCDKPADNAVDAAPSTSTTPASSSATAVAIDAAAPDGGATADADEPGRRGMRRGPSMMLFLSARGLGLPADQLKKVDDAEKLAGPADAATKDAAKDLHAELITGIKAGKIDTATLEPKYVVLEKVSVAEHEREVAALNALYAALDPAQRKAVVTSARTRQAKRDERSAHKDDAGSPDAGRPSGGRRSLDRLVRGLDLDADQQKKVDAIVPKDDLKGAGFDPTDMKKRVEALLTAFEKDGFDAKKSDAFDVKRNRVALEEETKLLSQLLPILKPEQREKLAAKMDKGPASHNPKRAGFGHRPLAPSEDDDFAP